MAKLTTRGRTVVHSVTREYDAETLQRAHDRMYPEGPFSGQKALRIWKRRTERLMSDRSILEKIDVQFQPDWLDKQGRRHAGTWRLKGKLKAGVTPAAWLEIFTVERHGKPSQWTVELGHGPTKVISVTRVMRAIESGEYAGFCLSCGAQADGVEPDAEGYRCESCGEPAVAGAENVLLLIVP